MYTQNEIMEKVEKFIQAEGSQNAACAKMGVSPSVISAVRKGNYTGNTEKIFAKLADYFGVKAQAELTYTEIEYAETYISSQVYKIIRTAQIKGGLAVACGDAGIGKTKAIKKYIADHQNSICITVNPCLSSVKAILNMIADRIGVTSEKSRDKLWLGIVGKLKDGMVLIFDESQHLTLKTIEVLRSFSDYFADKGQTLGVVFIGNAETVNKMGIKKAEFAQVLSRTKQTKIYTTANVTREDIKKLFPIIAEQDKEIDFLLRIAQTRQAVRGAVNLFSNAYDNENISYAGLVAMAKFMEMDF